MTVEAALAAHYNYALPPAPAPAANYLPFVISGNHLYVSGQISQDANGTIMQGTAGADLSAEAAAQAAERCALAILAQAKAALGDLARIKRIVKLTGFVNSTADFTDQPEVINGASNLLATVLGDAGKHSRVAVSVPSLPRGAAVEIDALIEIG